LAAGSPEAHGVIRLSHYMRSLMVRPAAAAAAMLI
jgi:hypothetical protein